MDSIPTVLCIDDFKPGLQTRKVFLEQFGFKVLIASSGPEGLELLKYQKVDAVILDYRMPEMNGEELAVRIRQMSHNMPLLLLTGVVRGIPNKLRDVVNFCLTKGDPPDVLIFALDELTVTTTQQRRSACKKTFSARAPEQLKRKTL